MEPTPQTIQKVNRVIEKTAEKLTKTDDSILFTDIHIRVYQESGEIRAFDDNETEITRCVVEEWIGNDEEDFYPQVAQLFRSQLMEKAEIVDAMSVAKPFSFVLENDEQENIAELYIADDETIIIGGDLMGNLEEDLDSFLKTLLDE